MIAGTSPADNDSGHPNPDFPDGRVGYRLKVLYCLSQFVKHDEPALEQRVCVDRRLNAFGGAIKQPHTQRVFEAGNRVGYCRLCHREWLGRFRHAAAQHHNREDMQVTQFEPPTYPVLPILQHTSHRLHLCPERNYPRSAYST